MPTFPKKRTHAQNKKIPSHETVPCSSYHYKTILLVDSQTKKQHIESSLVDDVVYAVISTGSCPSHLRIVATGSIEQIVVKPSYQLQFVASPHKEKEIQWIQRALRESRNRVIIATEPTMDGELAAWHICQVFGLCPHSTPRMRTEWSPRLLASPTTDLGLNWTAIYSALSRQCVDLMIGDTLTKLLWDSVYNHSSLSVGRLQTAVLRVLYLRQQTIDASPSLYSPYVRQYSVGGYFGPARTEFHLATSYTDYEQFLQECWNPIHAAVFEDRLPLECEILSLSLSSDHPQQLRLSVKSASLSFSWLFQLAPDAKCCPSFLYSYTTTTTNTTTTNTPKCHSLFSRTLWHRNKDVTLFTEVEALDASGLPCDIVSFSAVVETLSDKSMIRFENSAAMQDTVPREILTCGSETLPPSSTTETERIVLEAVNRQLSLTPTGYMVISFLMRRAGTILDPSFWTRVDTYVDFQSLTSENECRQAYETVCGAYDNQISELTQTPPHPHPSSPAAIKPFAFPIDADHEARIYKYGASVFSHSKDTYVHCIRPSHRINMTLLEQGRLTLDDIVCEKDVRATYMAMQSSRRSSPPVQKTVGVDTKWSRTLPPLLSREVCLRKGPYGLYCQWGSQTISLQELGNRDIANIGDNEVLNILREKQDLVK